MANLFDWISLSNSTHNGTTLPKGWEPLTVDSYGNAIPNYFDPITTQAYRGPNNEIVLTIKGTDRDWADWTVVNQAFATGDYPQPIKDLIDYANNELKSKYDPNNAGNISVTGFSQGGGLSQLLSYTFGWEGNAQNAPGAGNIISHPEYKEQLKNLGLEPKGVPDGFTTITEEGDPVSNFGNHLGTTVELNITESFSSLCLAMGAIPGVGIPTVGACLGLDLKNQHNMQKLTDYINTLSPEQQQELLTQIERTTGEQKTKSETPVDEASVETEELFKDFKAAQLANAEANAAFMSYARLAGQTEKTWLDRIWKQPTEEPGVMSASSALVQYPEMLSSRGEQPYVYCIRDFKQNNVFNISVAPGAQVDPEEICKQVLEGVAESYQDLFGAFDERERHKARKFYSDPISFLVSGPDL